MNTMKEAVKRRMLYQSLILGFWLIGCMILFAHDRFSPESFGFTNGIAVIGAWIAFMLKYRRLLGNDQLLKEDYITRNDERNILISYKASRLAFVITLLLGVFAMIVLSLMNMQDKATLLSLIIDIAILIYLGCWKYVSSHN